MRTVKYRDCSGNMSENKNCKIKKILLKNFNCMVGVFFLEIF